jgi:competence protein ComEA
MTLYTRPQLAVVLAVVAAAGIGLAVGRWRAAHPDAVERLETFDRDPATAATTDGTASKAWRPAAPANRTTREVSRPPAAPADPPAREASGPRAPATGAVASDAPTRASGDWSSRRRSLPPSRPSDAPSRPPSPLDVNRATEDELLQIPGIGPVLAARIVAARAAGHFGAVDDLRRVPGLGRGRLDALRRFLIASP